MAYVDPGSFSDGSDLTGAEMNVLADDVRYLKAAADGTAFAGVSVLRSTTQSIPTATYTDVSWGSSPIDIGAAWSSGASITVPAAWIPSGATSAYLEIQATARFDTSGTGSRGISVTQNGSTVEVPFFTSGLPSDTTPVAVLVWATVASGDVIKVQVYQSSGGALNVNQATAHVKRIGYA
jgi:hypothetical protein